MADISKIQTNGTTYDVKDATARDTAEGAWEAASNARNIGMEAQETADTAQSTADSKVSSVNIGTVTTGDEPAVTNSGTDKNVTLDFVFPSGGGGEDSRIVSGTIDSSERVTIEGTIVFFIYGDPWDSGSAMLRFSNGDSYSFMSRAAISVTQDGNKFTFTCDEGGSYIAIVMP